MLGFRVTVETKPRIFPYTLAALQLHAVVIYLRGISNARAHHFGSRPVTSPGN